MHISTSLLQVSSHLRDSVLSYYYIMITKIILSIPKSLLWTQKLFVCKFPIDINHFRNDKNNNQIQRIKRSLEMRFRDPQLADSISQLDLEYRRDQFQIQRLRKSINALSKEIGLAIKKQQTNVEQLKQQLKVLEAEEKSKRQHLVGKQKQLTNLVAQVGNIVHINVPFSNNEDDNKIIYTYGNNTKKPQPYWHIFDKLDAVDLKRGQKISGHRGYFLKNIGFKLARALTNYSLEFLQSEGYSLYQPPVMIRQEIMKQCCQLSTIDQDIYKITGQDNVLIATSEQPLASLYRQQILQQLTAPIKLGGFSLCFRKQAGAHGKDNQGLFRVHHFEKVEQFVICSPEDSQQQLQKMLEISKRFYESLEIPYRVVEIVSGALNDAASRKYDLEGWFPNANKYRQLVSASNCTDYQSRMLDIKYRDKKDTKYVHMLNGTLCAIERTLCCIVENYQSQQGIVLPEKLQKYYGQKVIKFIK